ncbi:vanadium-dependent haloperoxidase [Chitinophaga niabensis]|uniref:PAP2 superfamily protein n=1 Tax=Chitinophaga niabensis TaxID=536979 RepID=A0A1N6EBA4_9BACT|nr:vanadium-dependent haloperoxidase [Chitinophaga niabensis]SIN80283.1 PAP2 superfamily protein [Chitinophaga niabensis]
MRSIRLPLIGCLLLIVAGMATCRKQDVPPAPVIIEKKAVVSSSTGEIIVPVSWYQLELKLIRETGGFSPPVAARAIAYTGITLYEAVAAGRSLSGQLNALRYVPKPDSWKRYNYAIAANSAMAQIIRSLFPNASAANQQLITQLENDNLQLYADTCHPDVVSRSVSFGRQVATAIHQWSATDGGKDGYLNNFPADYVPPVGPGLWVPAPPAFQRALLPYWGSNRTMVKPFTVNIPPPAFSTTTSSSFYQSALAVYLKGTAQTPEENLIARYWADGGGTFTPPGHLIAIATQLAVERNVSLASAARLFAQVGISLNDAGILSWKYKYKYNVLRPVTYIRTYIDSSWMPTIATPPFPAYTSGHATFTAAAGGILIARFGGNTSFTDQQKVPEGFAPRSFNNFQSMINEAAISRVYGGIHYEFDSESGKQTGADIARRVLDLQY